MSRKSAAWPTITWRLSAMVPDGFDSPPEIPDDEIGRLLDGGNSLH